MARPTNATAIRPTAPACERLASGASDARTKRRRLGSTLARCCFSEESGCVSYVGVASHGHYEVMLVALGGCHLATFRVTPRERTHDHEVARESVAGTQRRNSRVQLCRCALSSNSKPRPWPGALASASKRSWRHRGAAPARAAPARPKRGPAAGRPSSAFRRRRYRAMAAAEDDRTRPVRHAAPGASGAAGGFDARRWRIQSSNPAMSAASTPPPSATIQTFEPSLAGVAALAGSKT